jgi:predicted molibdopterin-dependent oxidoreductase YjgC
MTLGEARREQDFGVGRIDAHPILGNLPAAPFVTFTFDGLPVQGREGEPIAASLLAAGIRIFRTMPRFGGARGGFCMIGRCTDCMVVVDGVPNVRACVTPVAADISVQPQRGLGDEDGHEPGERRA